MDVKFGNEAKRDERIGFHYREIEVDGFLYQLEYCSGPSLSDSGRTDQLYMQIKVVPPKGRYIEVYTLKRYPISTQDAIAAHILVDRETREVCQASDNGSLNKLVDVLSDKNSMVEMMRSYPSDFGEPLKPGTARASDWFSYSSVS